MRTNIKKKLELNKITICKLDNIELGLALAGYCPPLSEGEQESCADFFDCVTILGDITKGESTAGC